MPGKHKNRDTSVAPAAPPRRWPLVLLASIAAFFFGCEEAPPEAQAPNLDRVVVVGSQWYGHLPVWAGIERGIFEEAGLSVEWRFVGKSLDRLREVASGAAQFASVGEIAMLSAMAQGNRGFYWVGTQDIAPGFEGLVARQGIDSIEALRGKRIGLPFYSSVELTGRMLLRQHGLDPATDVQLVDLEVGEVPAAFREGKVDAALIWEPGLSQLLEVPGAHILGKDTDTEVYRKYGATAGPDVLILNRSWADADPERARRFLAAYFEALDWVRTNPQAAVDVAQGTYLQQEPGLILANLGKLEWRSAEDNRSLMSDDHLFGQADYILGILRDEISVVRAKPAFREWTRPDLLPGFSAEPPPVATAPAPTPPPKKPRDVYSR